MKQRKNAVKILIFHRIITHYREGVFRELYKMIGSIVCYGKNGPPEEFLTKANPDFPCCEIFDFYPYPKKDTLVIYDILTPLFRYHPKIIVIEPAVAILSNWLLFFLRPFFGYKIIIWTNGYNRRLGLNQMRYLRNRLRIWLMNQSDALIFYSKSSKELLLPYIKNVEKMFIAQNTLDTRSLAIIYAQLANTGKEQVKKEIGFIEKYNLIYVGRILQEKEPDRLIDVFRIISDKIGSVELHIIGDGPQLQTLQRMSSGLRVKFWGSITDDREVGKLLFASDIMVIPGYLGLSVMHAFNFQKPVVSQKTTDKGPFHSPEVEYLIDGKTGFLLPYGDNKLMAYKIIEYLQDENMQERMNVEIRNMVKQCSIENMLKGFLEAVQYVDYD